MSNAVGDQAREGGKESHSRERWALPVLRFCCGRKLALGGLRRLSTKTCNFGGQKHGDRNIMRDLNVSDPTYDRLRGEKAEHGRLSSSRNFEKRPSHASDPVILISLIDSLLYHAKSLVNAQSIMRPIPWMVKRSCGESKPISPCAVSRRLWNPRLATKTDSRLCRTRTWRGTFR